MIFMEKKIETASLADDAVESIGLLVRLRLPWLMVGLVGGAFVSFVVSQFEHLLRQDIALVYFLPFIVYMSDAVGSQTETIYIRNLALKQISFRLYLVKEFAQGLILGTIFGCLIFTISYLWLQKVDTSVAVGLSMFVTMSVAPVVALVMPELLSKKRNDPALGTGPFTTILQDFISIVVYFFIASVVLLK